MDGRIIKSGGKELKLSEMRQNIDRFTREMNDELRGPNPPSSETITTLYLLIDTEFMISLLRKNAGFCGQPSITGISHDPYHPLYAAVKRAFDWAQDRLKLAGFAPDQWPMRFALPPQRDSRRLIWEPIMEEILAAWKMYHRLLREGFRPFSVDSQGDPLLPVDSFDPQAGELMFRVRESA